VSCDFIVTSVLFLILPTDKFLIRRKARIDEENVSSASTSTLHVSENDAMNISVSNNTTVMTTKSKADKMRYFKYKDDYINVGFTWTGEGDNPKPQCLVYGVTLSNQSMVPNKLKRHLELNLEHFARKSAD
jgi:hypothetical protein